MYLRKAKFLESTRRGRFNITERGIEILKSNPARIDVKYLMQHSDPEFKEMVDGTSMLMTTGTGVQVILQAGLERQ